MSSPLAGITESSPILVQRSELAPDYAHIPHWRKKFTGFISENGISEEERGKWSLIFSEMATNAIRHGIPSAEGKNPLIILRWWIEEGTLWLEVSDPGKGPSENLRQHPHLPDDPLSETGRGLYIIKDFVDFWQPYQNPHGFTLRVGKTYEFLHYQLPQNPETEMILDELSDCYENLTLFHALFETLVKGGNFRSFVKSALNLFTTSGNYRYLHLEGCPELPLPEFADLTGEQAFQTFGSADPSLWKQFQTRDHVQWNTIESTPSPFADPKSITGGCVVPLKHRELVVGCLAVQRNDETSAWRTTDIRPLSSLAEILSIALTFAITDREQEDKRRIRHELSIATKLQRELLGQSESLQAIPGYRLFARCLPAHEVGGDFCEFRRDPQGRIAFTIIDVMGKGISAAMLGGIFRSHFLHFASGDSEPGLFLEKLNRALKSQISERVMFITATVGRLCPETGSVTMANAGHTPTLVFGENTSQPQEFPAVGPPLGIFSEVQYPGQTYTMIPGDRIVLVTDGLFEWNDQNGQIFGWERLLKWLGSGQDDPAEILWNKITDLIKGSSQTPSVARDDQTLMVLTRLSDEKNTRY